WNLSARGPRGVTATSPPCRRAGPDVTVTLTLPRSKGESVFRPGGGRGREEGRGGCIRVRTAVSCSLSGKGACTRPGEMGREWGEDGFSEKPPAPPCLAATFVIKRHTSAAKSGKRVRAWQSGMGETIMAVPKKKTSKSRRDMRRSHHALRRINVVECPNCGELKRPHHVCDRCGHYKGRDVAAAA
ncbi:MAG: large subunit ribosomal protein L32, partial [Rhodospirillaceae bacterium]